MAQSEMTIDLKLNTALVKAGSKTIEAAFGAIKTAAAGVGAAISEAFTVKGYTGYVEAVGRFGKSLANELLSLQLNFGRLKAAIVDAAAPIASVFVPILNDALLAAIRFVNGVGTVLGALFGGSAANDAFAESTQNAQAAQKSLSRSVSATGKAVKKSLAGFDQLDRLAAPTGGGSSGSTAAATTVPGKVNDTLSPQLQGIVDNIQAILVPLRAIDFSPLEAALGRLKTALQPFGEALFAGLKWGYDNLFVPLAAWTVEDFLPAFLDAVSAASGVLSAVLTALQPLANWLWTSFLQPIAQWTGGVIVQVLQWLTEKLTGISNWISQNQPLVEGITVVVGSVAAAIGLVNGALSIWNGISVIASTVTTAFGGAMAVLTSPIGLTVAAIGAVIAIVVLLIRHWDEVKVVAANVWTYIQNVWGQVAGWFQQNLLTPLSNGFKGMINGIIGFLNAMIRGIISGVNAVVGAINSIRFTVPSWVPGIGGKYVGFNLRKLTAPQIPYLAQGAVLPANKPFLAMVGEQRYGTNIEAPLTTIQQALANVLEGYSGASQTQVTVNFTGDLAQLGRVLKPVIDTETRRRGASLVREAVG